jgi:hypothetical protein
VSDSQSPQAKRGSSQDYEQFTKGESLDQIKPMRKNGGPENADASMLKSDLSIESINKRADREAFGTTTTPTGEVAMNDDRMIQRLKEQLRGAHEANAELRERVEAADKREASAHALTAEANVRTQQLERAHAKQKAAEDNSAAAQRKQAEAERELLRARGENEELQARVERLQAQADVLNELNTRIETAKHTGGSVPGVLTRERRSLAVSAPLSSSTRPKNLHPTPPSRHNSFLESGNRAPTNLPSRGLAEGTWRANPGLAPLMKASKLAATQDGASRPSHLGIPPAPSGPA